MRNFVLTSEAMTVGHPDKLCDQISDAVVDACLSSDPQGGVVAECGLASGVVFLSVRHRRPLQFDPGALARRVIVDAGYDVDGAFGPLTVMLDLVADDDLAGPTPQAGRKASHMVTAFGHACDHTAERLPLPIWAAHRMIARLETLRREDASDWLSPDAKIQVAVRFEDRRPIAIEAVAFTFASDATPPTPTALRAFLQDKIVAAALEGSEIGPSANTRLFCEGVRAPGGPRSHAGLTGRKTAADAYGGFVRHSSSALSGKDPARIERVAAYAARQAAIAIVGADLAAECETQLSFAPGDAEPLSIEVDSFGSGAAPDTDLSARLSEAIDFRIDAIVDRLSLWTLPADRGGRFYRDLAAGGHFGRLELNPPWEREAIADLLR